MILASEESADQESQAKVGLQTQKGLSVTKNYSMVYWREGMLVVYQAGHFRVESFKDDVSEIIFCWLVVTFYLVI